MNILVLAYDVPATVNMPGSPRLFSLCRGLAKSHSLTLVARSSSQERHRAFVSDPAVAGVFDEFVPLAQPSGTNWRDRQIHRIRRGAHFVTRYRYPKFHQEQCQVLREVHARKRFDMIYADGLIVAQYVEDAGMNCAAIIDLHDSLAMLYSREVRLERNPVRKIALMSEARSIANLERVLSRAFGAIITNSPVDEAFIRSLDQGANAITIPNGVDSAFFGGSQDEGDSRKLIFTGVMSYAPNEDAAVYFCDAILPLIQDQKPDAEFWIVGKDPSPMVIGLGRRRGVHVTGGVPDIRPYLDKAGVFVSPIRYGAGVKNKVLAALAMGRAVVASSVSLEGLDLQDDKHLLVADNPRNFADRVIGLMKHPETRTRLGQSGQAHVRANYSWDYSANLIDRTIHEVAAGAAIPAVGARRFGEH
jgi:glycosyltransferase involved in cell wall biosynthesis